MTNGPCLTTGSSIDSPVRSSTVASLLTPSVTSPPRAGNPDELAPFQLTELHFGRPNQGDSIADW
jgi:hypothetical protein